MQLAMEERAILSSTFGSFAVRLAGMAASFVFGVQLARGLGPDGLGTYGIIVAIALVLSVATQFGLQTLATREISVAMAQQRWAALRGYLRTFGGVVFGLSTAAASLWAATAWYYPMLLGPQDANLLGALLVPLYALTVLVSAELRALHRIVSGQTLEVLIRPAFMCVLLAALAIAGMKGNATVAVGLQVIASVVTLSVGLFWLRSALPAVARSTPPVRPNGWIKAGFTLGLFDVLKQIDATYGILLLGAFNSEAEAGYFRVAISTIIFVATPLSIFNVVLAPSLARLYSAGERRRLQQIMSMAAVTMFATAIGAVLVILSLGKPLIGFVFGQSYELAWLPLLLLAIAQAVNGFFGVGWVLLSMSGGERALTFSFTVSVSISIAVAIPLTILYGATGAATAAVIGSVVQNLVAWRGVRRHSSLESSAAGFLWRARSIA